MCSLIIFFFLIQSNFYFFQKKIFFLFLLNFMNIKIHNSPHTCFPVARCYTLKVNVFFRDFQNCTPSDCKTLPLFPSCRFCSYIKSSHCFISRDSLSYSLSLFFCSAVQKVGNAGTAGTGQTTFGWTK